MHSTKQEQNAQMVMGVLLLYSKLTTRWQHKNSKVAIECGWISKMVSLCPLSLSPHNGSFSRALFLGGEKTRLQSSVFYYLPNGYHELATHLISWHFLNKILIRLTNERLKQCHLECCIFNSHCLLLHASTAPYFFSIKKNGERRGRKCIGSWVWFQAQGHWKTINCNQIPFILHPQKYPCMCALTHSSYFTSELDSPSLR